MSERMTDDEIQRLTIRHVGRNGTAEVLCSKAYAEIMALRSEIERLTAAADTAFHALRIAEDQLAEDSHAQGRLEACGHVHEAICKIAIVFTRAQRPTSH